METGTDAVCFDMDGVLVDSEDYWGPYERSELFPRACPGQSVDIGEITGMNYREIYDYLDEHYAVAMDRDAFLAWFDDTAATLYGEDVSLLPGARELVGTLRERGVAVALVSSSPHDWIDVVRDRFNLAFDDVISADAFDGPGKPAPGVYAHAVDRLDADGDRTIAVEDSGHGIEAARRAGLTVVGFRHGEADGDGTHPGGADYAAESPADLRGYLLDRTA